MLLLLVALVAVLLVVYVVYRKRHFSLLERNGIYGPKPSIISGNIADVVKMPSIERHDSLVKKYGKIVGYYIGWRPTVLVADPDLAKSIQIKDFHYFADRPHMTLKHGLHPNPSLSKMLIRDQGKRWKEVRSALTPTFSGAKLRIMTPIVNDAINNLLDIIDRQSKSGEEFDIYDMFQNLTTDVIGRTAFGIQSNVQNKENDKFLNAAKDVFNMSINQWMFFLIQCFPSTDTVLYPYRRFKEMIDHKLGKSPNGILLDMARDIVQIRKQNPNNRRKDLLQLMLDTKISTDDISYDKMVAGNDVDVKESDNNNTSTKKNGSANGGGRRLSKTEITLTEEEIQANCVLFYEAGYETTSTALGFMAHILVNYPDVQEKVRREVQQLYESEGKLDFNTVNKLEYMECVLNETMRVYPPVITFVSRECLQDYKYKDITIPKGAAVQVATYYLHHDPDYWSEPEKFDPDRFSAERKHEIYPSSWQPFGSGPRNCIGLRFALFEAKLALAKLLLAYRLESVPKTEIGKLTTQVKILTLTPKNGVWVKAVKL
ncbi:thromboxane-A synthase-like [Oppia nitens]|uniref:thromboxane-A synthase-like n=1 Tax=Oppia nitens TaxID=1686743 RepID=UPI0023DCBDDD|nr:thromboxane-A synthase-like [Oppia nitens]